MIVDNQCTQYVFDQDIKSAMKRDGEIHDGKRRCSNKVYKNDLCKYHYGKWQDMLTRQAAEEALQEFSQGR